MLKNLTSVLLSVSCLLATVVYADTASNQRTINVQGNGNVQITPNQATIRIAVETTAPQAKPAVQSNADKMTNVVNTLKKDLGNDDKISTSGYNLAPVYEYDKDTQRQVLTGYQVTNYVTVTTKKLDQLGAMLDTATQAGANRVDNLQFGHDQWHSYEQQAMSEAVVDAKQTAEILAKAAEVNLGPVLQIQPQATGVITPMREFSLAKTAGATTPVEPGQMTVNMNVLVTYGIE